VATESVEITRDGAAADAAIRQGRQSSLAGHGSPWAIRLQNAVKRSLDVLLSALMLVAMIPVIAVVALAIVVESRGPVFYRAERVGRGGRAFRMLKFRKMPPYAAGLPLTMRNDARFTRLGAFLARSKLDELPQLLNVLRGDMSLVGPRPEDRSFVDRRRGDYDVILQVRPGLSGFAQLAFADESRILSEEDPVGHYVDGIFPQKCALDRLYIHSANVWTDIRILFWTVVAIVFRRPIAVHRATGRLSLRRHRAHASAPGRRVGDAGRERSCRPSE
jgi:lipopolysaccharide/colanic/teichoic acid biosynthesis glycosyltransferase